MKTFQIFVLWVIKIYSPRIKQLSIFLISTLIGDLVIVCWNAFSQPMQFQRVHIISQLNFILRVKCVLPSLGVRHRFR